ncbi:hypothetical protein CC2G_013805 [Coprinopsis cinerea AmutBmut pab1-1]|nr:hypothetical protein CC2G_013805 [Coprinopsis cinerea AmutBmut pab1-1]
MGGRLHRIIISMVIRFVLRGPASRLVLHYAQRKKDAQGPFVRSPVGVFKAQKLDPDNQTSFQGQPPSSDQEPMNAKIASGALE